jgi:hypothetical protein
MTNDVNGDLRPGRKVRYRCSARTQTGRPCRGAVPAPGCRCARHSGAISFPNATAYKRTVMAIVRSALEAPGVLAGGAPSAARAVRRCLEDVLARRQLRSWGAGEEAPARPALSDPNVIESTAQAHTDGSAGG